MVGEHIPPHIGWYLSGFSDGEGSFNISFRKKTDYKTRWQPVLSFNVSQRDRTVLNMMKQYFQCGIIKQRRDGLHSYDVTSPSVLEAVIVPFFHQFPLFSKTKQTNFLIFEKAVALMVNKQHLTPHGLTKLVALRETINEGKGRKRKYTKDNILLESSETTRQTSH